MDAHLPRLEGSVTARERMKRTLAECDHQFSGVCGDCVTAAILAHAEAVRAEAVRRVHIFQDIVSWQAGESRNALIWEIEQAVSTIEVT